MIVWMSAARGSVSLWGKDPPRILMDNCVLRNGLTHTNAWISTGISMWGGQIPVETGYSARVPVNYALHNRSIYEVEVPYFAPLAKMAKTGRLRLFTSTELLAERNRHSSYDPYTFGMNLWSGAPIETLPDMRRSVEIGYCLNPAGLREAWSKEGQVRRLLSVADSEFLSISKKLPHDHLLDFYHLWTAKNSECSICLTTDSAFRRVFENNIGNATRSRFGSVRILKPSELGQELGVIPIPHHVLTPLDCDWFYEIYEPQVVDKQRIER